MVNFELVKKLEGLQTVETAAESLGMSKQSTLNLLSKLKKEQYVTVRGGGKRKRLYNITTTKQRPRDHGMFDILNKYSGILLNPWYDHQVHGTYGPEEALIDAIHTKSFRVILASLHLFKHIKDWKKVYRLAQAYDCWQQVGALYDVARLYFRVKPMPHNLQKQVFKKIKYLFTRTYPTTYELYKPIEKKWKVAIPFLSGDIVR